jgi:diguanylate cyclase (GGDEF)-like protein
VERAYLERAHLVGPDVVGPHLERPDVEWCLLARLTVTARPSGAGYPRAAPVVRRWWSRPDNRVTALTVCMGVATLAVAGALAVRGVELATTPAGLGWVAILVVLFASEGFVIHVRVRRGGHAMSLTEIPMVLGLLSVDPVLVIGARLIGGGGGLLLLRRQRGAKLAFNVGLIGVQATVAAGMFTALGAERGALGPREWLASYAAMLLADLAAVVLVTAVIAVHDDPGEWRRLPAALRSVPLAAIATTVALVSVFAGQRSEWALLLLGAVAVALYLAYRALTLQEQGRTEVEQLYAFTRALDGAGGVDELVAVILDRARDQVRAATAELVVPHPGGAQVTRTCLDGQRELTHTSSELADVDRWYAGALAGEVVLRPAGEGADGLAVPVPFGDVTAALVLTGSLPDSGPFTDSRLRLLAALGNHASVSLGRAGLVDRLRREVAEKEHLALHDSLSDLPNRRHFHGLLEDALRHAGVGTSLAVLVMDLDRFKEINDALGHDTGDALLLQVGTRLHRHLDGRGVVARLGGDEFAVLLADVRDLDQAVAVAHELAEQIERPIQLGPMSLDARISIGVASAPLHGNDAQTLLRHADVAMYAAKHSRSVVRVYESANDQNSPQRLALIADLREAIERHELTVVFQPKVDPKTGAVTGAEALARWHHPRLGPVAPDRFIPLAEHSGLVRPLTSQVLETSLRRRAGWARAGHQLHVAVNLSPNSLLDATLPDAVARLLALTGTPPAALTLELTESSIMVDPAGSLATLERLHRLGVKLSIDDFGTGYSSLGRLRDLPIHEVKIDRSFVQRIAVDHRDRAVVRSAVQLGHALDLEVVAEGVEDAETYSFLAEQGCDVVQGYHVSRPLPADDFDAWLAERAAGGPLPIYRFAA